MFSYLKATVLIFIVEFNRPISERGRHDTSSFSATLFRCSLKKFCLRCARGLKYFFIVKLSDRILIHFRFASGRFSLSRIRT